MLLSATVAQLRAVVPGSRFVVRDGGHVGRLPAFGPELEFTGIDGILADRGSSRSYRLIRFFARMASLLRRCNWLIFAGGTVFHEQNAAHSLLLQWLICRLARLLGVHIAALGVGVSELHSRRGQWLVRDIVTMSDLFLVRDEAARRQCGDAVKVTDDLVFGWENLLRVRGQRSIEDSRRQRTIALTVCPQAFRGAADARAVASFAEAIRAWQVAEYRVVFLVFHALDDVADDRAMFKRIVGSLGCGVQVETRSLNAVPEALAAAYRDIDAICGMRFHGFVLAAMFGVPFVGVAHDNKISEICRHFDMTCLDASGFDGAVLARAAMAVAGCRLDPMLVQRSVTASQENFRALSKFMT
jgi:polysaccharide pyruvyl transferase WcaK-like protein